MFPCACDRKYVLLTLLLLLAVACNSADISTNQEMPNIIFSSWYDEKQQLVVVNPVNNEKYIVLPDTSGYAGLKPSPDGKAILFTITHIYVLFKLDLENEVINEINSDGDILEYEWSPDGNLIAFTRRTHYLLDADLFIMDKNGGNERQVNSQSGHVGQIDWSPDGQTLVYTYSESQRTSLYTISINGGLPTLLTDISILGTPVDWSPISNEILYMCPNDNGDETICLIDVDTKESRSIAAGRYGQWSPDGTSIVFSLPSSDEAFFAITTINQDGTNQKTWAGGINAAWAQDGVHIAYERQQSIYVLDLTSGEEKLVTDNGGAPLWITGTTSMPGFP